VPGASRHKEFLAVKKLVPFLAVLGIVSLGARYLESNHVASGPPAAGLDAFASAFAEHRSGIEVTGQGTVTRILSDDRNGSPHQRFILTLPSGQTLLVAHNLDLAERIPSLQKGDRVRFKGEYEWNPQGGVIHWTHDDPRGRHHGACARLIGSKACSLWPWAWPRFSRSGSSAHL
jgi:hypothetical protein